MSVSMHFNVALKISGRVVKLVAYLDPERGRKHTNRKQAKLLCGDNLIYIRIAEIP